MNIHQGSLSIYNSTHNIGLGSFSINYNAGTATLTNNSLNNTALFANYRWGDGADIRTSVKGGILSGFEALEQTGDYLPIIVLAVVIVLVLTLILGFTAFGGVRGGGSAL